MSKPVSPKDVRARVLEYADRPDPESMGPGKVGLIVSILERELAKIDPSLDEEQITYNRHLVTGWLTTEDHQCFLKGRSTKEMYGPELNGLWQWIGPDKPNGEKEWATRPTFPEELKYILARAESDLAFSLAAKEEGKEIPLFEILMDYTEEESRGYVAHRPSEGRMKEGRVKKDGIPI